MIFRRFAVSAFIVGMVVVFGVNSAAASDKTAVMAPLHQFVDGLNKGDTKAEVAACASPASVIDDFPPHEWQGPTACADWARAYNAGNKAAGLTGGIVTLKTPWHVAVTGDRAYVVVPADFNYKLNGNPVRESNSVWTVALKKGAAGWRITGWAWAQH